MQSKKTMNPSRASRSQAGFSIVELLIAMFIVTEVMAAILLLFTGLSDIARAQTNVAEVQQVQRISHRTIAQMVRETGLGGLPPTVEGAQGNPGVWPDGLAIALRNNVTGPGKIRPTAVGSSDEILVGSDVLILRGVFSTPVYYVSPQLATFDLDNPAASLLVGPAVPFDLANRQLTVPGRFLGVRQDFRPMIDAINAVTPRLLIVRDLLKPALVWPARGHRYRNPARGLSRRLHYLERHVHQCQSRPSLCRARGAAGR